MLFGVSLGQSLVIGKYESAERWDFQSAGHPGMDVDGNTHGCNTLTGRFEVKELLLGAENSVQRLLLTFEQHCEGETPALRGEISFGS
ncbi:hypothetical protein [Armatimonas sp.]|uniref:hypothetical protein n=1 Tax=Armatimonas sp. TaxID=1872638 RepID=UPI00374D8D72